MRIITLPQSRIVSIGLLLAAYVLLDWGSFLYPYRQLNISPWNPLAGLCVFVLWRVRMSYVGLFWLGRVFSDLFIRNHGEHLLETVLADSVIIIGYLVMARLLRRYVPCREFPPSVRSVWRMTFLVAVVTASFALFFVLALSLGDLLKAADMPEGWRRRFVGDLVGIMTLLPLLLWLEQAVAAGRVALSWPTLTHWIQLGLGIVLIFTMFGMPQIDEFRSFYLLFLPMIWVAMRDGFPGAAIAVLVGQILLMAAARLFDLMPGTTVTAIQILTITLALTGIFLGAVVSEQRRTERQLAHNQAELARVSRRSATVELAAAIAHEVNQPLTAIVNYSSVCRSVLDGNGNPELLRRGLNQIAEQSRRAGEIIHGLRTIIRGERCTLRPESLRRIVRESVALIRSLAQQHHAVLHLDLAGGPDVIQADRVQLQQVLYNLLRNAIEAQTDPARPPFIHLSLHQERNGWWHIRVQDQGPGIHPGMQDHLFHPFQTSKGSGMGLGLSISRSIVEMHGGTLSREENQLPGACFVVMLPGTHAEMHNG